jgi:hypothetical protein
MANQALVQEGSGAKTNNMIYGGQPVKMRKLLVAEYECIVSCNKIRGIRHIILFPLARRLNIAEQF